MGAAKNENEGNMKRLILHVGFHKTGSSAIQASLVNGLLVGSGYAYYGFGEQNGSVPLYTLFADQPHLHPQHIRMGLSCREVANYRQDILSEFEYFLSITQQQVVLSGEDCSLLSVNELAKIPIFFKQYGFEVRIVIYVRPWHNLISSIWCELLKHSRLYIDLNFKPELWDSKLDMKSKISRFDTVFGKEQVMVYGYEKNNFPNGCVVTHFCSELNIEIDPTRIVHANMGFSLPTAQLFYIYRKFGPPRGHSPLDFKRNQALIYHLESIKGSPVYFHSELSKEILAPFRVEKNWVDERVQGTFQEVFHDDYPYVIRDEADLLNLSEPAMDWLCTHAGLDNEKLKMNAYSHAEIAHQIYRFELKQYQVKKKSFAKKLKKKLNHIFNSFLKKNSEQIQ